MQTFRYNKISLLYRCAINLLILPVLGAFMLRSSQGPGLIIGALLLLGGPVIALKTLQTLTGDGVALQFDERSLLVCPVGSRRKLSWRNVTDIKLMVRTQRLYGLIPINRTHFIDFEIGGGVLGSKTLRLPLASLGLNKDDGMRLVVKLEALRKGVRLAPVTPARRLDEMNQPRVPGPATSAPHAGGFDPDAAMARYLAKQGAQQQGSEAPSVAAAAAARPTFGRKFA